MSTPRRLRADRLISARIVAVLRARSAEAVPLIAEALVAGGVTTIEITTSTPDFARAIRETRAALGTAAFVGAGTLLTKSQAGAAVDAGAEFLVSPVLRPDLMPVALAAETPILLGAYTPTECQTAHELGADFVKLFPADTLGPSYIRSLRAPLPHLRLVPTGGVTVDNVAEFLAAGCAAVGVGSSLLRNDWIEAGRWADLTLLASRFIAAAR
jgi:2-dehydro-3-deoxyphosphogluconate aldolase/(4S)-4-hydroxy-2-oxoglutarate aldolase